jgi:hypothetical protein
VVPDIGCWNLALIKPVGQDADNAQPGPGLSD